MGSDPSERPLRVVHCPINTAGVPWANVQALRRRGVEARLVVFNRYKLHSEADWSLGLHGGFARKQLTQWSALLQLLPHTDVFHFYFGLTLVPQSLQFPILRAHRKRSVMHYLGSDIRGRAPGELAFGKKAGAQVVGSYDAIRWVPEAEVIPPGLDVNAIEPAPPSDRARPVILHAPSSRRRKGTEHVIAACEGLEADIVQNPLALPADLKSGRYTVSLGLFDGSSGKDRPVEFALQASLRGSEGYYRVAEVEVASTAKPKQ